jgi:hypothetical protein
MGGANQFEAPASVEAKGVIELGTVRIHESGGKVHFHADAQNLKVACPVASWFSAWEKISQTPGEWTFADVSTGVTVKTILKDGVLDAEIIVFPISVGDTYAQLQKFTK